MKMLCIETSQPCSLKTMDKEVIKGEIYTSIESNPKGISRRGIDMWHKLKERNNDFYHTSLFIPLSDEEGVIYDEKEELMEI